MADPRDQIETANNRFAEVGLDERGEEDTNAAPVSDYLQLTKDMESQSTSFQDVNLRRQWDRNYRAFHSQHGQGSKYFSDSFKHRSKLFRPKTRAAIRKNEARVANAFFSTEDVISVQSTRPDDEIQKASADFWHEDLNLRLREDVKWFLTCMGAFQTGEVSGVVLSKQYWRYSEAQVPTGQMGYYTDPETGEDYDEPEMATEVVEDKLCIDMLLPENVKIDKGADWIDPINSSPYVQNWVPMYVGDVLAMTKAVDDKTGRPKWYSVDNKVLRAASKKEFDSTRQAREGLQRRDSKESGTAQVREFEIVWVVENFARRDGVDMCWWTLGTESMLSEPVPTRQAYPHLPFGKRPIVMGYTLIEAGRLYPSGKPELAEDLQIAANETANLRIDNVRYAMTGRPIVRRGDRVDLKALARHVPGAPILVENADDITWDRPPDVTASSYEEQDRINADMDDLLGNFDAGSIQTNRQLNETVGGMNLLSQSSDVIGDYDTRVFIETWAEPVMQQCLALVQHYETDERIIILAGNKAKLIQKYGISEITDEILSAQLTTTINVGIGNTDPMRRLEKFVMVLKHVVELASIMVPPDQIGQILHLEEIAAEMFGKAGYKDGKRFISMDSEEGGEPPDPRIQQMEQVIQELGGALEELQAEAQSNRDELETKERIAMAQAEVDKAIATMKAMADKAIADKKAETELMRERMRSRTLLTVEGMRSNTQQQMARQRNDGQGEQRVA